MCVYRVNADEIHRMRHAPILLLFCLAALTSGCVSGSTDTASVPIRLYAITSSVPQASTYPAGSIMSVPVNVTYNGVAFPKGSVRWVVLSGKGLLSDTISTTDTLGASHILWTLGTSPGDNALSIAIGDAVDTLHVTAVVGTASYLDRVGNQVDTVATSLPLVLQVVVRDRSGNPVAGSTTNWSASGGQITATAGTSDATGLSTATFSATAPGNYNIVADLPGEASMFFQVTVR